MTHLIYITSARLYPTTPVLLNEAFESYHRGNKVIVAYCCGHLNSCFGANIQSNQALCKICKKLFDIQLKKLPEDITICPVCDAINVSFPEFSYNSVKEIKQLEYRGAMIGYGALSSFVSLTRNADPEMNESFRTFFDNLLTQSCKLADSTHMLIERFSPDVISVFNGRHFDARPVYDVAKSKGIQADCHEIVYDYEHQNRIYPIRYEDGMPHNIDLNDRMMEKLWATSPETDEVKIRKGKDFFERRRNGLAAGDKIYTAGQQVGLLPEGFDKTKRNFVIFNSSEDEFFSVGSDFDRFSLFESQLIGIRWILENVKDPDIHFYLRVHPNLKTVTASFHMDLYKLPEEFNNITVISAFDKISTYDLMDAAEKIIVFGSTMGAEAAYWEKPVILLGGVFYYHQNICHTPKNTDELLDMLEQKLPLKDKFGSIKYGYYLMNRHFLCKDATYVDLQKKVVPAWIPKFGNELYYPKVRFLGSYLLGTTLLTIIWKLVQILKTQK